MSSNVITFESVGIRFASETIYEDLSFDVREGEFLCILGPSGCGKSTSLRVMGDLLKTTSGHVTVDGRVPGEAWQELAYIFQSPRLAPWRDAIGNVVLGMELRFDRMPKREMAARAGELLDLVGLGADAHKFPAMLSGGERQRVAIARALSVDPKIILMDEPFSALDLNTRRRLRREIVSIWQRTGKTVVFVTHDIDEALVLADRIVLLSNKPTRILEILDIPIERPRDMDALPDLKAFKAHLHDLFGALRLENAGLNQPSEETEK